MQDAHARPRPSTEETVHARLRTGAALMAAAGIGFMLYALIFFVRNFSGAFLELGIGPGEVDVSKPEIQAFSESLYLYISHLHVAVSGFIAATGLATAGLAWYGVRRGEVWAWVFAVAVPVLGLAVALPLHYTYGLATMAHLGLIYLATLVFAIGAVMSGRGLSTKQKALHRAR